MTAETHSQLASFIWSICNLLRGPYKRNEYRKVMLPLTVLRRFDCLLAPTKARVLAEHAKIKSRPEGPPPPPAQANGLGRESTPNPSTLKGPFILRPENRR